MNMIPCTACRYCVEGCPKQISIPDLFAIMNIKQLHHDWNADYYYEEVHTAPGRRASDCLKCGKCEKICPQHLPIRKLLEEVAKEFDKPEAYPIKTITRPCPARFAPRRGRFIVGFQGQPH